MPSLDGGKNWYIEVNWKPEDEKTNECKILKITFPDGTEQLMKKEHLIAVLFALGNAAEQREMIPQKITKVRKFNKMLQVTATKDVQKGEKMIFPYSFEMAVDQYETVGNLKKVKKQPVGTGTKL